MQDKNRGKCDKKLRRERPVDFRFTFSGEADRIPFLMDQSAFYLINHYWANLALDLPMAVASSWDFWWPFLVVGGLAVLGLGGFRARAMLLAAGLAIGMADGVVVHSLKHLVGRPRPHEELVGARTLDLARAKPRFLALGKPLKEGYSHPGKRPMRGNSFPSGHAANTFALATVVAVFYRRWGWLAFLPAAVVAYSRIYVGSHWPVDVLASCFLGAGIALVVVAAFSAAWRKWGGHWLPALHASHPSLLGR